MNSENSSNDKTNSSGSSGENNSENKGYDYSIFLFKIDLILEYKKFSMKILMNKNGIKRKFKI